MGDGVEARMNVAAVRRVDPYAKDIVETSAHVALYSFDDNEWIKTEVEGALFVYSRRGPPPYSVLVMNRLSTENLIEPVTEGLELQLQEPFLLYRNSQRRIFGLWFYDKEECARVAAKIERLVRESTAAEKTDESKPAAPKARPSAPAPAPAPAPASAAPVDIFSMLSKAQDDYNSNKAQTREQRPRAPDIASKSVMDFFAKAGGGAQLPVSAAPGALFGHGAPRAPGPVKDPAILQRLMSDPVHSVEHIEKQQRSVTPKAEAQDRRDKRKNGKTDGPKAPNPAKPSQKTPAKASVNGKLESEMAATPRRSPPPPPFAAAEETPQKPALMPPTMFTSSACKIPAERPAPETATPSKPASASDPRPEPLTRNQLLQALNYLMKNDAEFMTKLHEAYVKSFSELVS